MADTFNLLLQTGDHLLLENSDNLALVYTPLVGTHSWSESVVNPGAQTAAPVNTGAMTETLVSG